MNRSRGLAHRFQEGSDASSDEKHVDGKETICRRGVVALVWVADASGADSARAASCNGGTPARRGAVERKRGNREERENMWRENNLKGDVSRESERACEGKQPSRDEKGEGFLRWKNVHRRPQKGASRYGDTGYYPNNPENRGRERTNISFCKHV